MGRGSEHIAKWFPVGGTLGPAHIRRCESTFIEEVADLFFCVWAVLLFVFVDVYVIHGVLLGKVWTGLIFLSNVTVHQTLEDALQRGFQWYGATDCSQTPASLVLAQ